MIKKLWNKIFPNEDDASHGESLNVLERDAHSVSRGLISKNALKVLHRLNSAGYEAYLVGGGVRDILLGLHPKDFDIATSATPEQVHKLFKNCRLIGRRFRLAHIMFGREIIEVATFRACHQTSATHGKTSDQGMLLRDNVYGSLEEDAVRRDFTINALYYSADDQTIKDHVNGLADLDARQLKLIGDPEERYREDPVRILRAIRLACKLELDIETNTAKPIASFAELLSHVSSARLWDESHKLFLNGHALNTWQTLRHYGVARHLFKETIEALDQNKNEGFPLFLESAFNNTDKRIAQNKPVTPAFLFAVLLWEPTEQLKEKLISKGLAPYEASQKAANQLLDSQRKNDRNSKTIFHDHSRNMGPPVSLKPTVVLKMFTAYSKILDLEPPTIFFFFVRKATLH